MIAKTHQPNINADWYEEVCRQLDALKKDAVDYADEGDVLPHGELFDAVKQNLQQFRQLAGFPTLGTPDAWLGPDGQIGITWNTNARSFDLIFSKSRLTARLTVGLEQQLIDANMVPLALKQFAA
jgi:hypothetical protein